VSGLPASTDLLIVGGGIHGAAAAWEAARRGIDCVLLERDDFASGTSGNSLGIIHGGLRYLQGLDLVRARASALEVRRLMQLAPHLVEPLPVRMATYREWLKSRSGLRLGLLAYDAVSAGRNRGLEPARRLPRGRVRGREALADLEGIADLAGVTGLATWCDARAVSPERLVLAFALSAQVAGARIHNRIEVTGLDSREGRIVGARLLDLRDGGQGRMAARAVLDTRGHRIGAWNGDGGNQLLGWMRGANLVLDRDIGAGALGLRGHARQIGGVAESRLLFAVPRPGGCAVGTWYFPDRDAADSGDLDARELAVCVDDVRSAFPGWSIGPDSVRHVELGRLPLAPAPSGGLPRLAERARLVDAGAARLGPHGLFQLIGVKLTTGRLEAERAVRRVAAHLGIAIGTVADGPLVGGDIGQWAMFLESARRSYARQLDGSTVERLARLHGSRMHELVRAGEGDGEGLSPIPGCPDTVRAEVTWALEREWAVTAGDVLHRRCALGVPAPPEAVAFVQGEIDRRGRGAAQRTGSRA